MKVMISQPMNGIEDKEIIKIRNEIVEKFDKMHIDVVDSFVKQDAPESSLHPRLFYLGSTIRDFMSDVDAVYFVDGWRSAAGCRIEHKICQEYGIKILYSDFFENKEEIACTSSITINNNDITCQKYPYSYTINGGE